MSVKICTKFVARNSVLGHSQRHTLRGRRPWTAQLVGRWGQGNWNSVRWGKNIFCTEQTKAAEAEQKSLVPTRQAQRTNQGRPLLFVLFESPFPSVSTVSRGHTSLVSLRILYCITWTNPPILGGTLGTVQLGVHKYLYLNCTMLGWLSFLRCRMSVSLSSFTFFTAIVSPWYLAQQHSVYFNNPEILAPWKLPGERNNAIYICAWESSEVPPPPHVDYSRRLAVRQARVRSSARPRHSREVFPTELNSDEKMEMTLGEWRRMNVLYEGDGLSVCTRQNQLITKRVASCHQPLKKCSGVGACTSV